ncbi:TPA: hypothetical protein QH087_003855 [Escherichia coli]|nr:hypothetical protein [Escherichia coli]
MMKFEILWNEAQHTKDGTLYRIYALRDIPQHNVKAGDRGGWIAGGVQPLPGWRCVGG